MICSIWTCKQRPASAGDGNESTGEWRRQPRRAPDICHLDNAKGDSSWGTAHGDNKKYVAGDASVGVRGGVRSAKASLKACARNHKYPKYFKYTKFRTEISVQN